MSHFMKKLINEKPNKPNHNVEKIKTRAIKELELSKLPDDVTISTMTIICKIDTEFICPNIAKYIDLKYDAILSVTHGKDGDLRTNRSIIVKKNSTGKKKKKKNVFYNQVSMYVDVKAKRKKPVNIKIFSNGSIQMTGCKTVDNAMETLSKVLPELKKIKAVIDYKNSKVIEKPFATKPEMLEIKNIKNIKIAMINSNFKIPFKVDRGRLYNLLLAENYQCLFDPVKHACVNIKYDHPDKTISVFVFEKGSIIITGARNCSQILDAYNFINRYLLSNHKHIVKNDALTNSNIIKYLDPTKASDDESDDDLDLDEFDLDE